MAQGRGPVSVAAPEARPVILITGAAGRIGKLLNHRLTADSDLFAHYGIAPRLRLTDINRLQSASEDAEVHVGDLSDPSFVATLFSDGNVRAVIHLAGYPREADWEDLLEPNIRSSINIWEAARKSGVDRILYASSNHAVGLYPRSELIDAEVVPKPDSRYGLTKVFCEQMGFLYARKFGVRSFSIRIGSFLPEPTTSRSLATWISYEDMVRLVRVGLIAPYTHQIVYGVSNNTRSFWDNRDALRLGYAPRDNAEDYAHLLPAKDSDDEVAEKFQGGPYASEGVEDRTLAEQLFGEPVHRR